MAPLEMTLGNLERSNLRLLIFQSAISGKKGEAMLGHKLLLHTNTKSHMGITMALPDMIFSDLDLNREWSGWVNVQVMSRSSSFWASPLTSMFKLPNKCEM